MKNKFLPFALGLIFLLLVCIAFTYYRSVIDVSEELISVRKDLKYQKIQNMEMSSQLSTLADEFAFLDDTYTQKIVIKGNHKTEDFAILVYWNDLQKKAKVSISEFPNLNANQCLQMWADVNDQLVSIAILNFNTSYMNVTYLENAASLTMTIEPKGGSEYPNVNDRLAKIKI